MAKRTKTGTLHMRIHSRHKMYLTALANMEQHSEAQYIEDFIEDRASNQLLNGRMGPMSVKDAIDIATSTENSALTLMRTFYIAPTTLSSRDVTVACAIIGNDYFAGTDEIFSADEIGVNTEPAIPGINCEAAERHLDVLREYAAFVIGNPKMKVSYADYRKMANHVD